MNINTINKLNKYNMLDGGGGTEESRSAMGRGMCWVSGEVAAVLNSWTFE